MKRNHYLLTLVLLIGCSLYVKASDTVFVHQTQIPILIERQDNVLFYFRLDAKESRMMDEIVLDFGKSVNLSDVQRPLNSIMEVQKLYKIEERKGLHRSIIYPVIVREEHWQRYHLIQLNVRKYRNLLRKSY